MMGADNFANFTAGGTGEAIAAIVPIAVFNRPGRGLGALASPAARYAWRAGGCPRRTPRFWPEPPPAWVFLPRPARAALLDGARGRRRQAAQSCVLKASPSRAYL